MGERFLEVFNLNDEEVARLGCFDTLPATISLDEAILDTTLFRSDSVAWSILSLDLEGYNGEVFFLMSHTWPKVRPIQLMELYPTNDEELDYEYHVVGPNLLEVSSGRWEDDYEDSNWIEVTNHSILISPSGHFLDAFDRPIRKL